MFLAILFAVRLICSFMLSVVPIKLQGTCISKLLIISFGRRKGISSFLLGLWKNEYFVFSTDN